MSAPAYTSPEHVAGLEVAVDDAAPVVTDPVADYLASRGSDDVWSTPEARAYLRSLRPDDSDDDAPPSAHRDAERESPDYVPPEAVGLAASGFDRSGRVPR